MPTQFVRIRDKSTNTEISVSVARAKQLVDRGEGTVEILTSAQATDRLGRPLPASRPEISKKDAAPVEIPEPPSEPAAEASAAKATTAKSKEQAR